MRYKFEEFLIEQLNGAYRSGGLKQIDLIKEVKEVYAKAKKFDELKKQYVVDLGSALDTTLYYTHPDAPCMEDMGSISILLQQLLQDLED